MPSAQSRVSTDHDEIRQWAEARGAQPACVRGTGDQGDIGMLRLEFPGAPGARDQALQPISWDDWFEKFDERGLCLLFQQETVRGQRSNFNKLISRETAEETGTRRRSSRGQRASASRQSSGRSRSRSASRKSGSRKASRKAASATRKASGRNKSRRSSSSSSRKSGTRAVSSNRRTTARKSAPKKAARSTRSVLAKSERGSARSRRTASSRGRENNRSQRRAA